MYINFAKQFISSSFSKLPKLFFFNLLLSKLISYRTKIFLTGVTLINYYVHKIVLISMLSKYLMTG